MASEKWAGTLPLKSDVHAVLLGGPIAVELVVDPGAVTLAAVSPCDCSADFESASTGEAGSGG